MYTYTELDAGQVGWMAGVFFNNVHTNISLHQIGTPLMMLIQ
jgi:hypothetical protein